MRLAVVAVVALLTWLAPSGAWAQADVPPLPDRNPLRAGAPVQAQPLKPGEFPSEPWTEAEVTAATDECKALLGTITIDYRQLPPLKEGLCGAPAPILVSAVGNDPKVEIKPPATMSCPLAKALSDWLSHVVQPEAKTLLGSEVVALQNATSYSCRNRYGGDKTPLSEHALANALDVSQFVFASGERITVLDGWPKPPPPPPPTPDPNPDRDGAEAGSAPAETVTPTKAGNAVTPAKAEPAPDAPKPPVAEPEPKPDPKPDPTAEFLKFVHDKACQRFGTVLGPEANAAHKDHFHFDQKKRRSGFCQ
jgi:hypothetical protein